MVVVVGWVAGVGLAGCSDSGDSTGGAGPGGASTGGAGGGASASGGGGSGGQACEAALASSFFSAHCLDCVESACCAASVACLADPLCVACIDDTAGEGCDTNAAAVDVLACVSTSPMCADACGCISCGCVDDGTCDAGFMGYEVCSCPDCVAAPVPACQGVCEVDGVCADEDPCTCADCADEPFCAACNLDRFCDTYGESCACADCVGDAACEGRP